MQVETRPYDVNNRAAVVLTWPYGDMSDSNQVEKDLRELLASSLVSVVGQDLLGRSEVNRYEVGPAADGLFSTYLFTLYPDIRMILTDGATLVTLATAAVQIYRTIRGRLKNSPPVPPEWASSYQLREESFLPIFSEPFVLGLCYRHYRDNHPSSGRVKVDSISRSSDPQFMSASHPGGGERYTIRVWTGQTSYIYVVDSQGRATEHLKIRGRIMEALEIPNWFDEPDFNPPAPSKFRFFEERDISIDG